MHQDEEHLRLLSIFHYVCAGFSAFGACLWALILCIGITLLVNPEALGPRNENPEEISDLSMTIMAGCLTLFAIGIGVSLLVAGRSLSQRKRYTFCVVIAGFACMLFPLGTALGIFSLIVLVRPSVKALFDQATSLPPVYSA